MRTVLVPVPMTRLTTVSGSFAAHVLAARLIDEGFDVELRGGPALYGLTVGEMAAFDVFVPDDQIDEASYVLLVSEVDIALDEDPDERHRRIVRTRPWAWRVVAGALVTVPAWSIVHVLSGR
jgi:hypothetical protein